MTGFTGFTSLLRENPCSGCPAPCCRMQVMPYKPPESFSELDHMRFLLLFPGTEIALSITGEWSIIRWGDCHHLDCAGCTCTVHRTVEQPRICVQFDPFDCWYRRNFTIDRDEEGVDRQPTGGERPPDLVRFDRARFERWLEEVELDSQRRLVAVPSFQQSLALVADLPIAPLFERDPRLAKAPVALDPPRRTEAAAAGAAGQTDGPATAAMTATAAAEPIAEPAAGPLGSSLPGPAVPNMTLPGAGLPGNRPAESHEGKPP